MLRRKKKTIHFIRHAESEHNIPPWNVRLKDPYLTEVGRTQAEVLGVQFPYLGDIELVVCSPMKRTLQTALVTFKDYLKTTKESIIALPELQELSNRPCDTGSSLAELLTEFREDPVDMSRVMNGWDSKDRQWAPTEQRTIARMAKARAWLRNRPEMNIVVVGHAHCMQLLTREAGEEYANDGFQKIQLGLLPPWLNCEWRTLTVEEDLGGILVFTETKSSKRSRAKGQNMPNLLKVTDPRKSLTESRTTRPSTAKLSLYRRSTVWSRSNHVEGKAATVAESPDMKRSSREARSMFNLFS